jgi:hypothetical protein
MLAIAELILAATTAATPDSGLQLATEWPGRVGSAFADDFNMSGPS